MSLIPTSTYVSLSCVFTFFTVVLWAFASLYVTLLFTLSLMASVLRQLPGQLQEGGMVAREDKVSLTPDGATQTQGCISVMVEEKLLQSIE